MTSQWQLQPIFGSYLLAVALTALLFLLLFIRPTFGHLSVGRRRWLNLLRGLIALLLLFAMLRPTHIRTEKKPQTAQLPILFDISRSMGHRDAENGNTRWEQQLSLLRGAASKLDKLGDNFEVELVGFSAGIEPQDQVNGKLNISSKPNGEETDIGQALADTLQRNIGKRIAAVFLISDGAQRAVAPKTPPQQAARQLDRLSAPLYTITLGRSQDQTQSRDVSIENLQDEYSVFVKNEFALRVGIRIQGYANQAVPVSVVAEYEDGSSTTLGPQDVVATEGSQVVMADFSFHPEKAGQYKLRVRAAKQPGESIDNNESTAFLNVREGGLRVLLLSSALILSEQKFIRRALDESQDIELDYQLENLLRRANWPVDLESKVRLEDYDVFLVGDIDASAYRPGNWSKIASLVESGRGLMMFGGYHSFGPGGYAENALANVLPIEMERFEREPDPSKATRKDLHLERELVMLPTTDSSITHLAPDDQNEAAWRKLKPLRGANRFGGLKDRSTVLAKSEQGDPLLVQGVYGVQGRVLALATESTHRWRRFGQVEPHKKFWRQCVLWLARRDKQQANSVFIELPQRRFQARSRVSFQVGLTDEAGDIVADADLQATLTRPDGSSESVPLNRTQDSNDDNSYQNALRGIIAETEDAGDYRLTVRAMDGDQPITTTTKDFVVEKVDFELGDPAANPGLMEMLARMTSRVGGKAIAPEQLSNLIDEIKASPPKSQIETQSKWQLGDTPVDAWCYFGLLVALLTLEWFFRKKWGLV